MSNPKIELPRFGDHYDSTPTAWIELALLVKAIDGGPPALVDHIMGTVKQSQTDFVKAFCESVALRPLKIVAPRGEEGNGNYLVGSEEAMASCRFHNRGTYVDIHISTASEDLCARAREFFKENVFPDDPASGPVYALAKHNNSYVLQRLGSAGVVLERENYTPHVIEEYDHIVADLNTTTPCGRLIVLSGDPGTGKTYLVRSLLREAPKTTFVIVPPSLVGGLGDPQILPSLIEAKDELPGPILIILEDADMCLVPRQADNMTTISALLNLGDGILGSLLDVRILATTNAKKFNMDAAALREGRLCRQIEVEKLKQEQANRVLGRLAPKASPFTATGELTLAQIYKRAREAGWVPPKASEGKRMKDTAFPR